MIERQGQLTGGHTVGLVKDDNLVAYRRQCHFVLREHFDFATDNINATLVRRIELEHAILDRIAQHFAGEGHDTRCLADTWRACEDHVRHVAVLGNGSQTLHRVLVSHHIPTTSFSFSGLYFFTLGASERARGKREERCACNTGQTVSTWHASLAHHINYLQFVNFTICAVRNGARAVCNSTQESDGQRRASSQLKTLKCRSLACTLPHIAKICQVNCTSMHKLV